MYCRMCGKLLDDTDRHCRYCGAATGFQEITVKEKEPENVSEEVVFNPPYESDQKQSRSLLLEETAEEEETSAVVKPAAEEEPTEKKPEENLKEFISENEIEKQKEQEKNTGEAAPEKNSEFTWNVYEFPKSKKTEDIEFNWKLEDFGKTDQKQAETAAAAAFEEELFQEIKDEANRIKESNIDRFFTFSKKNEEFQELLDREYEKFNRHPETITKTAEPMEAESETDSESGLETPEEVTEEAAQETKEVHTAEETKIKETPSEIHEEETVSDELKIEETVPAVEATTEGVAEVTAEITPEAAVPTPENAPKAEHLKEMEEARALFFGEELIKDNETIKKKLSGEAETEDMPTKDKALDQDHQVSEAAQKPEPEQPEAIRETDTFPEETTNEEEPWKTVQLDKKLKSATMSGKTAVDYIKEEEAEQDLKNLHDIAETEEKADAAAASGSSELKETESLAIPNVDTEEETDEKELKRNRIGMTALIIIGIILVLEISVLGIRYFAPKSGAAEAINSTQSGVLDTVTGWFDSIGDKISGKDSNDKGKEETDKQIEKENSKKTEQQTKDTEKSTTAPDPSPMADKAALVATQLGNNVNIQQVKANDTLAFQEGRDYGIADINKSKPITNNIWQTPQGADPVYYDRSIVGTIIAFDSQWIDYVSGSSKSVLDLLKKDSRAYKLAIDYPKVGKVKETFKLLEIGEIRQGAQGFYVWVHEEIQLTEQGKTTERKYNWIYYLEPVDGKMNIVNYFKFK